MPRRAAEHETTNRSSDTTRVTRLTRWLLVAAMIVATMIGAGQLLSMPQADADVDCAVDGDDDFEENDSKSTATPIDSGETEAARICGSDADYFKFDVDAG